MSARRRARAPQRSPDADTSGPPAVLGVRHVAVWCADEHAHHQLGSLPAWRSATHRWRSTRWAWLISRGVTDTRTLDSGGSVSRLERDLPADIADQRTAAAHLVDQLQPHMSEPERTIEP